MVDFSVISTHLRHRPIFNGKISYHRMDDGVEAMEKVSVQSGIGNLQPVDEALADLIASTRRIQIGTPQRVIGTREFTSDVVQFLEGHPVDLALREMDIKDGLIAMTFRYSNDDKTTACIEFQCDQYCGKGIVIEAENGEGNISLLLKKGELTVTHRTRIPVSLEPTNRQFLQCTTGYRLVLNGSGLDWLVAGYYVSSIVSK